MRIATRQRRQAARRAVLATVGLLAAVFAGLAPAGADGARDLTPPGALGDIRIRPVALQPDGSVAPVTGDPKFAFTNPNRTVGDVEPPPPTGNGVGCADPSGPDDCARTLAVNDPALNASAGDSHTHYHPGDRWIVVNEVHSFAKGDTILIGSPSCNFVVLGSTCRRYRPGYGFHSEQPAGEVAHVVGGDAGKGLTGPGALQLRDGLRSGHPEGTSVVKVPTAYTGQQLQVAVPHWALLGNSPGPVTVTASLIPPEGSHDPTFDQTRLPVDHTHPDLYERIVTAPDGNGTFFIPRTMTRTATIGPGFDIRTPDTWYSVVITARDPLGFPVASGIARFKLNPVAMLNLRIDRTRTYPTYPVAIFGALRDATSPAALNRPVEDAAVEVMVTKPDDTRKGFYANSCTDNDPTAETVCGGDEAGYDKRHYGEFKIHVGGARGLQFGRGSGGGGSGGFGVCEPCAQRNIDSAMDTSRQGTYRAIVSVFGVTPFVGGYVQWEVRIL